MNSMTLFLMWPLSKSLAGMPCAHTMVLGLYVPPGQTINVTCPHCGASIPIHGYGPTC